MIKYTGAERSKVCRWEIGKPDEGQRVDRFLALRVPQLSRTYIQTIMHRVWTSERKKIDAATKLRLGEVVFVEFPFPVEEERDYDVETVFEDEHFLFVDKPPGVLVHPTPKERINSLILMLRRCRRDEYLTLVHRLDRETSGLLVLAKSVDAARVAGEQFRSKSLRKIYLARVYGRPPKNRGVIELPVGKLKTSRVHIRKGVIEDGSYALTKYEVIKEERDTSVLRLELVTGRNHQLRVHLEAIDCPIVGDELYGRPDEHFLDFIGSDDQAERLQLHAWQLSGELMGKRYELATKVPRIFS